MFCDRARLGAFAASAAQVQRGEGRALFKILVTAAMFQRRQDLQIMRILRGIAPRDAHELTSQRHLLMLVDKGVCPHARSNVGLSLHCDLLKENGQGGCTANPKAACHLKRHTVLLKRYGDFGKMPTSAALLCREAGVKDLGALRTQVLSEVSDPYERAQRLEREISRVWRIERKLAAFFLSAVCNPDLSGELTPWSDGVEWAEFVVIDSNVDRFLRRIGYHGGSDYDARRAFVMELARRIDLRRLDERLHRFNPRIVQQAMYLFMSITNRRAVERDCATQAPGGCRQCPSQLRWHCPTQVA
jgi:hypothetical protein